jgi:tartrate dehydratase beta subunit/fumarate hydratase class I family protein
VRASANSLSQFTESVYDNCNIKAMLACGAAQQNTTDCCVKKGVLDGKYAKCSPFCQPAQTDVDMVDFNYMPCMDKIHDISMCFLGYVRKVN